MSLLDTRAEPIDFTDLTIWRWRTRRFFIGYLLITYCTYAGIFFMSLALPADQNPLGLKIDENQHLWISATFGFLGSVFSVTRVFVLTSKKSDFSVSWYIVRPVHGTLMAVFIYYAFRAGQLVFYSGTGTVDEEEVNVWTISILAILAGAFTEDAYARLSSIATGLFRPKDK